MLLGMGLRIYLARKLGPEDTGTLYFAESLGAMFFTFLAAGFPTYILQKAPARPDGVPAFFKTMTSTSLVLTVLIFVVYAGFLVANNYDRSTVETCILMAIYSAAFFYNRGLLRRLYLAIGQSTLVSQIEIFTRFALVAFLAIGIALDIMTLRFAAIIFAVSELGAAIYLYRKSKYDGFLSGAFSKTQLQAILSTTWPFFLSSVLVDIYGNLDLTLIKMTASSSEVGLYGAATRIKGMCLMLIPLIQGALQPTLARAWYQDREHFSKLAQQAIAWLLILSFLIAAGIATGSDLVMMVLFGNKFDHASVALTMLSVVIVLTYFNVLMGTLLTIMGAGKQFLGITVGALLINFILNFFFVPSLATNWHAGGSAAGAAISLGISEAFTAAMMIIASKSYLPLRRITSLISVILIPLILISINFEFISGFPPLPRMIIVICILPIYLLATKSMGISDIRQLMAFIHLQRK